MSLEMLPVVLFTKDRSRMLHFLSDVFDFEVDFETSLVHFKGHHFELIEREHNPKDSEKISILFRFRLTLPADLKELVDKFDFYSYRRGQVLEAMKKENDSLLFFDLDGRQWQFSYEPKKDFSSFT